MKASRGENLFSLRYKYRGEHFERMETRLNKIYLSRRNGVLKGLNEEEKRPIILSLALRLCCFSPNLYYVF